MSDRQQIKRALERAVRTVTLRPERGQRVYRNVAVVGEGTRAYVEEADRTLTVDVGKALGGNGSGPTPSMILRSAMSSCVAIGIKQWAARFDLSVDCVEVVFETEVDARGQLVVSDDAAPGFEETRLDIAVTSNASRAEIEKLVTQALAYSPLMDVFLRPQKVHHRVSLVRTTAASSGEGMSNGR
ncbi:MAG: OsmC family protein [Methyloceanibacter sp.]|nr:OsmC family protein [Methyloceanibacter sp.]